MHCENVYIDFARDEGIVETWIGAKWRGSYHFTDGTTYTGAFDVMEESGHCVSAFSLTLRTNTCDRRLPYICYAKR